VIPARIRRSLKLREGSEIVVTETGEGELLLSTQAAGLRRARELVRRHVAPGESLVAELLAERRREAKRER
jgi:AbrB family looped-hinge helix DNA binding protein